MQDSPEPGGDHTPDSNTSTPLKDITSLTQRKSSRRSLEPIHDSGRGRTLGDGSICEVLRRVIEYTFYILFLLQLPCFTLLLANYITSGTVRFPISPLTSSSEQSTTRKRSNHYAPRTSVLMDQGRWSESLITPGGMLFVGEVGRCRRTINQLGGVEASGIPVNLTLYQNPLSSGGNKYLQRSGQGEQPGNHGLAKPDR